MRGIISEINKKIPCVYGQIEEKHMKKLQCELCGSVDIVKIGDDMFQCQYCGCKYTTEEAKKIIFGTVTIQQPDFNVIGGRLIGYNGVQTEVEIPDSVTVIGTGAFLNCSGIKKVTIPESVYMIESGAFCGCSSLTEIIIPDSVRELGNQIFYGCKNLSSVILSCNIEKSGVELFKSCNSLRKIVIPEGIKKLDFSVFRGCTSLEEITFPYSLQVLTGQTPSTITKVNGNIEQFFIQKWSKRLCPTGVSESKINSILSPAERELRNQLIEERRAKGLCPNCGGEYKGYYYKECKNCGRRRDYFEY